MPRFVATVEDNSRPNFRHENDWFSWTLCRNIQGVPGGIVVARSGGKWRLVCFWCEHDKKVKAGFGATDQERTAVANFGL